MMRSAAGQGFPQAQAQLADMERQLSPEDRTRGEALAAELTSAGPQPTELAEAETPPQPQPRATEPPRPERPREGPGVSYEHPPEDGRPVAPVREVRAEPPPRRPEPVRTETPRPSRPAVTTRTVAARPAAGGSWRIQLGAFRNDANARRQWAQLRRRVSALGPLQPSYQRAGALTRLRTGIVGSRAAADRICAAVRASGEACIPVP